MGSNGQDITGTEGAKVRSIAIATITSIAQARGRNVDWAVSAVSSAVSASATEAASLNVVNGMADTLDAVLADAQGREVTTPGGTITLDVVGKPVVDAPMNPVLAALQLLSDPNIAFLLFVVGVAGLLIELVHPTIVGGVVGALCLILAFIGFGSLPLNVAGLILLAFGMLLFALESQITSHGVLGLGGLVAFVIGASILYSRPVGAPVEPSVAVATPVILGAAATFAVFVGAVAYAAVRIRRMPAQAEGVGTRPSPGAVGTVQAPLAPVGTIHLAGETWTARAADGGTLDRNTAVRLIGFEGLTAIVAADSSAQSSDRRPSAVQPTAAPPGAHP